MREIEADEEDDLLAKARAGDHVALQQLLIPHASSLIDYIGRKTPKDAQAAIDPEDVLQQVMLQVFRDIKQFEGQSCNSFRAWIQAIAEHRLQDVLKAQRRQKRGGNHRRIDQVVNDSGSVVDAIGLLSAGSHSPSGSAARREAVDCVREAIGDLPEDYRRAVELRLLEGKTLEEVAELMHRTPRAVQGLVDRAKKKLRADLDRMSP